MSNRIKRYGIRGEELKSTETDIKTIKSVSEDKLVGVIKDQSDQMIALADINNTYSKENDDLRKKVKLLELNINNLENQRIEIIDSFNFQGLLFIMLILLFFWLFNCSKSVITND